MNVKFTNASKQQIQFTYNIITTLFPHDDTVNVYVSIVNDIRDVDVDNDTWGICVPMNLDLTMFDVRVMDNWQWRVTMAHELYHVFQNVVGLSVDCDMAELFGLRYTDNWIDAI